MQEKMSADSWLVVVAAAILGAAAGCWFRGWHDARRHPLGGQVCRKCLRKFGSLEEAGFKDSELYDRVEATRRTGS